MASGTVNVSVVQPGSCIKPEIDSSYVPELVHRLYGLKNITVKELKAYDDKNYHIQELNNRGEPGYVLKISNSLDSAKPHVLQAQTDLYLYLESKGVVCPKPVKNVYGKYFSSEELDSKTETNEKKECLPRRHLVRLLEFLPGRTLGEVTCCGRIFYQMGKCIAELDNVLKGFKNELYLNVDSMWKLNSVPKLSAFLNSIKDAQNKKLVTEIIEEYTQNLPEMETCEKGLIHGDFNQHNIVAKTNANEEWDIYAILDFSDASYGPYLFELAITICYAMLLSKDTKDVEPMNAGGYVLRGYQEVRPLPEKELNFLKLCISARFTQSLVMGSYTYEQNPNNDYLLDTASAGGWSILKNFWNTPQEKILETWQQLS